MVLTDAYHRVTSSVHPACSCCGGPTRAVFATRDVGQSVSDEVFYYDKCEHCSTYQLVNVPNDLSVYYPASYYDEMDASLRDRDAKLARGQLAIFAPFVSGGRLIDVGPAEGALLRQAETAGFDSRCGVERDQRCCEMLRGAGIEVAHTDDPILGLEHLEAADAVTMFHVIEHVRDPMGLLDAAAGRVRPGGVLVIATPNPQALSLRICGPWWRHIDAPRHLYLIPLAVIRARAERQGLKLVAVTTSDPVGLLCDSVAWAPWTHHITRKFGDRVGYYLRMIIQTACGPLERRGRMRGSTYTAVFQRYLEDG